MTLNERIDKEYIDAYKARQTQRIGVLRLLKTAVKNRLVELKRPGGALDDAEMLDVILRQAKQRQDSIEQFLAASRKDLADREAAELVILQEYLPPKLDAERLEQVIAAAIAETGASGPRDMGKVMALIMEKYKGQTDGREVSAVVRKLLAS